MAAIRKKTAWNSHKTRKVADRPELPQILWFINLASRQKRLHLKRVLGDAITRKKRPDTAILFPAATATRQAVEEMYQTSVNFLQGK